MFNFHYRIRANKPPLLIKPPSIQNSNKPPPFCPKTPLFGAFLGKFWKNFNKPPPQNLDFLIDRQRFIKTLGFLFLKVTYNYKFSSSKLFSISVRMLDHSIHRFLILHIRLYTKLDLRKNPQIV